MPSYRTTFSDRSAAHRARCAPWQASSTCRASVLQDVEQTNEGGSIEPRLDPKAALVGKNDLDGVAVAVGGRRLRDDAHRQELRPGAVTPRNFASPPVKGRLWNPVELAIGPPRKLA